MNVDICKYVITLNIYGCQVYAKEVTMQCFLRLVASSGNKSKIKSCKKPIVIPWLGVFCESLKT